MAKHADIISSFADLPMGKYEEICEISEDTSLEEIDRQVKIISILTDTAEDTILSLPITEYKGLVVLSRFLGEFPKVTGKKVSKVYRMGGMELVPTSDIQDITTAQYKDFQEYIKKMDKNVVPILSCFLIPKGKKYLEDYDVREVQSAIRENLSVQDAMELYGFFIMRLGTSMLSSLTSLVRAQKITQERKMAILERLWEIPS